MFLIVLHLSWLINYLKSKTERLSMKSLIRNNKAQRLFGFLASLAGINGIILIHEMGHFLCAQLFNVPTPVFSLGFGPTLFSFFFGKTLFKIAALPIGGYVEINQTILAHQTYVAKILIISGGILSNILCAYVILWYYTMHNYFALTSTIRSITPGSPADLAGLQPQDIILAYNHQPIDNPEIIIRSTALCYGKTVILTIKHGNDEQEISIELTQPHPVFGKDTGWLGIELQKQQTKTSLFHSLGNIHHRIMKTTQEICRAISHTMKKKERKNTLMGPIGIMALIGKSSSINPDFYWFILALLSLNMGLFNMLPLPFFDGGKALIITIEKIFSITISPTIIAIVSYVFLVLFVFFMARVTIRDIKKLGE